MEENYLNVYSIFESINGEINLYHQGSLATFLRLAGCNLDCIYCDTLYAIYPSSGTAETITKIAEEIREYENKIVTITGGEPLLQEKALCRLINELGRNYRFSIETNGTIFPGKLWGFPNVSFVMDWKLKSSGAEEKMDEKAFNHLGKNDFVKFVVGDEEDAKEALKTREILMKNGCRAKFVFSPISEKYNPKDLVLFLRDYKVKDFILNLQIHKIIWGNYSGKEF